MKLSGLGLALRRVMLETAKYNRQQISIKMAVAFERHETLMLVGNQGLKKANNILLESL